MNLETGNLINKNVSFPSKEEAIKDYRLAYTSRQVSLMGRREVLTGKAKFGIFGDGKELPQLAMSKVFRKGDIRSGYYRDQTFAFAKDFISIQQFFAQLYAHTDLAADPSSAGRQMNNHLASRNLTETGEWQDLTQLYNSSADVSCTAGQMPRLVGLAQASKLFRELPELQALSNFSKQGNEIVFGTIGNASCAEGLFWEAINAVGVLQVPLIMSIWDDDYGISVPNEYQITKSNISEVLKGFQRDENSAGFEIFTVKAWDYLELCEVYRVAEQLCREEHIPCLIHVIEVTQPQGHSTSGSHERYKSQERLTWERENDCLLHMRNWLLREGYATEEQLKIWEEEARKSVRSQKSAAWKAYQAPIKETLAHFMTLARQVAQVTPNKEAVKRILESLRRTPEPSRRDYMEAAHKVLLAARSAHSSPEVQTLAKWRAAHHKAFQDEYNKFLTTDSIHSPQKLSAIPAEYAEDASVLSGYEVLNKFFDLAFERDQRLIAFGEDVGQLGDVNQGMAGLQKKYGKSRVMDTGIREATIIGQAVGLAMRGLRPIAEIQYLDYLVYALQTLTDDLASLAYRTYAGQKAPAIIRTRGHRLEGIWHAGSPLGMIINSMRGIHICVPRNMTQAAGLYQTLLEGDEPALVIEVLNGYRLKEKLPVNLGTFRVPLGQPEVLREGSDITVVTYGACCRIALEAAKQLESVGISLEVIDIQTLLPFDTSQIITKCLEKTNRIIFMDEDVPGGASAFMMQQVLEEQKGYYLLDSRPRTLSAQAHRPAYGTDGDYWSKPQTEHLFRMAYDMMHEADPQKFPKFY